MVENIDTSLVDWSRAQFALTAMYHWLFVPLTLGLGVIMSVMVSAYYRTGKEFWKHTAEFWMKLFGINFAIGVATGIILEFEFGTNWSNYSWFVGDIFGAPLAIEGILAFFMESTFIAILFFGWDKVGKRLHESSAWLTTLGASLSAYWILVANAWMQYPVGMAFNPDTVRNEMVDFWAVAFSPVAVNKFFHTILSGWVLGAAFVIGISCWYLLKRRQREFSLASIKLASIVGVIGGVLVALTGDGSAYSVTQYQPMKLAAMEGLYTGQKGAGLIAIGVLNPEKKTHDDGIEPFLFKVEIPKLLSLMGERDADAFIPGITDLIEGGYTLKNGSKALSAEEKIERGKRAIQALADYRMAVENNDSTALLHRRVLEANFPYFGYGYIKDTDDLVPSVPLTFYAFHIMVMLGGYFIAFFALTLYLCYKKRFDRYRWLHWVGFLSIPLAYLASQSGWVVAEVGRQPWVIQDLMPVGAGISRVPTGSVQLTFFLFLAFFTVLLIAEVGIMLKAIKKGPKTHDS